MSKSLHDVVDESVAAIREAAQAEARNMAVDQVTNDDDLLKQVVDRNLRAFVSGLPFTDQGQSPLIVEIACKDGGPTFASSDLIDECIETIDCFELGDEDFNIYYGRFIEALQSGIDRLKAYEAKRRQAQS